MRTALLVLSVCACVQASSQDDQPAHVFDSGLTFAQFVGQAHAQREVWLKNASRTGVPPDAVNRLTRVRNGLRLVIVAEDWCLDSVHTVPYIANLAAAAGVEVRIVDRTAGASLASAHRARDGRPVTPIVVLLRNGRDVGAWVERPAVLQKLFDAMADSAESARRFADRATWSDEDHGRTTIAEVVALAERTALK